MKVAPDTHKIAFENAFVRILEVHVPAGKIEPRHRHPHGLSVYFTDWEAKVTVDGKPPQVNQRKKGTFAWSDAVVHTVVHTCVGYSFQALQSETQRPSPREGVRDERKRDHDDAREMAA